MDARAFSIAGHVRALLQHCPREALALHERARALNPSLAMAWGLSAAAHLYLGELAEARSQINRALRLAPRDPHAFLFNTVQTTIHLLQHDYEAAVQTGREVSELHGGFSSGSKAHLAALGHLGLREEAAMVRTRLLVQQPQFTVSGFVANTPLTLQEHISHYAEGLRLAGVPN